MTLQDFLHRLQLSPKVALDFSAERLRIWADGQVMVDEPSLVAIEKRTQKIVGVGTLAAEMRERLSHKITVLAPYRQGTTAEMRAAEELLKFGLGKTLRGQFFSPVIVAGLPRETDADTTDLSPSVTGFAQLLYQLGAKEVIGVERPLAAAIGAGVPVADVSGGLIAVLDEGMSSVGVVALGSVVETVTLTDLTQQLVGAVIQQVLATADLVISIETAEVLLQKIARVGSASKMQSLLVAGKAASDGAPKEVIIRAIDLTPALQPWAEGIAQLTMRLLRSTPAELTTDVVTKGLILTGSLANVRGLEDFLVKKLGIPVATAEDPELAVVRGLATITENLADYKQSLAYEVGD